MIVPAPPRAFQKNPEQIEINQQTFENGPFKISTSDVYVRLTEDVVIDFSSLPHGEDPFHLGIFAAIIVAAPRVVIDLNTHKIEMSKEYQKVQRFFSILELDQTPFPKGKGTFNTENISPSDITVKNGTLGLSSHFGIHAAVAGDRLQFENLKFQEFEVSAISLSGCNDLTISDCHVGPYVVPKTSSEFVMLRDLETSLRENGNQKHANQIKKFKDHHSRISLERSDALVRCIVLVPRFNVHAVPTEFDKRIHNILLKNIKFDTIEASPVEIIGASETEGGEVIKDVNGNIIAMKDIREGNLISISQAEVTPKLTPGVRKALLEGKSFSPIYEKPGLDRRAHDLVKKASLFVRIDGATNVSLINLKGARVRSFGNMSAAVGIMLNNCINVFMRHVAIEGVHIDGRIVAEIDDNRPSSGFHVRSSQNVNINDLTYSDNAMCSVAMNETSNVSMKNCNLKAPLSYHACQFVKMD